MTLSSTPIIAFCTLAFLPFEAAAQRFEPWPTCWTCVSRSNILSPAIGIDLELTYLTAAVRFHNGSIHNLVKVDGQPAYRELMRSLALQDDEDVTSSQATFQDQAGQQELKQRSDHHHPPTSIQILSTALTALKAATDPLLTDPLSSALLSYPNFPGLQYQLIQSAMATANIKLLGDQRIPPVGAASAANGIGLCQTYTALDECESEESQLPTSRVLAIEYTAAALTVTLSPFQASRKGYDWIIEREWDLGADALPTQNNPEEREGYWERVGKAIERIPAGVTGERKVTHVIVMGEAALDETFLGVMRDALKEVLDDDDGVVVVNDARLVLEETKKVGVTDPTFAAARGTAEFAKRMVEGPDGCVETGFCKWWRRRVG